MDFAFSTEQQTAFDQIRASVSAAGPQWDTEHAYRDAWQELGALGLLGLSVPAEHGGGGFGALDTALRLQAFGHGCADTGLVFAACAHLLACAMPIAEFGSDEVRQKLLPQLCGGTLIAGNAMTEAEAGSDISRLDMVATEVDGGFLLDGAKTFVTNGPVADVVVTYATTDPAAGYLGTTGFVVETGTPGLILGEPFAKMGLESARAGTVRFESCFVPSSHLLGGVGSGAAVFAHSMLWERACLLAGFLGGLDRLQEQCTEYVRSRRQFGQHIGEFQAVAHRVVDMKQRLEAARLLLYRSCWELDNTDAPLLSVALSKLAVSETAVANALEAVQIFGGRGYAKEYGIEVMLRDAVPTRIFSGTSDIQRVIAARELGL